MNVNIFLHLIVVVALTSCAVEVNREIGGEVQEGIGGQSSYFFSTSVTSSGQEEGSKEKKWKCGFEQIAVPGPDGKMIIEEVPMECDPLADVYIGCPAPMIEQ